jgi:hypothetical protein
MPTNPTPPPRNRLRHVERCRPHRIIAADALAKNLSRFAKSDKIPGHMQDPEFWVCHIFATAGIEIDPERTEEIFPLPATSPKTTVRAAF